MDTNESIRHSPFHSPFYSGRTAYGGAASGQRLRMKRRHTETEPSVVINDPYHICVVAYSDFDCSEVQFSLFDLMTLSLLIGGLYLPQAKSKRI